MDSTPNREFNVAETAAAIADAVRQAFYDRVKDQLSGFPGIWKLCAQVAIAIEDAGYEDDDWLDLMTENVATVIFASENLDPRAIAQAALAKVKARLRFVLCVGPWWEACGLPDQKEDHPTWLIYDTKMKPIAFMDPAYQGVIALELAGEAGPCAMVDWMNAIPDESLQSESVPT